MANTHPTYACKTCYYSSLEQTTPHDLTRQRFCRWGPAAYTSIPTQDAKTGRVGPGITIPTARPVQDVDWCHQWEDAEEFKPSKGGAITVLAPN